MDGRMSELGGERTIMNSSTSNHDNNNLSIWSLMTAEEKNGQQKMKKKQASSFYYKSSIVLAIILLLIVALLAVSVIVQWNNAQKIAKWQNGTDVKMDELHKNISQLAVLFAKAHDKWACVEQATHRICPFNKKEDGSNRWDVENCGEDATISQDGLTASKEKEAQYNTNVRAKQPFSFKFSAHSDDYPCCARHFYFEIYVKKMDSKYKDLPIVIEELVVGLIGPSFAVNSSTAFNTYKPVSYGIGSQGSIEASRYSMQSSYSFEANDTLGCGLLRLPDGQFKLFFTKNGQLYHRPDVLDSSAVRSALYPIVMLKDKGTTVEANFGADLEKKPFKFDISQHNDMLTED